MNTVGGRNPQTRPAWPLTLIQEQGLLRNARRGDDSAFATILEHHDEVIRSLVARMAGTDAMDELTMSAYVKAYRALPRLGESASVHTWLYRITYTTCLDRLRREWRRSGRKPHGRRADDSPDVSPPSGRFGRRPAVTGEGDRAVDHKAVAALEELPVDQRAVLLLVDRHEFTTSDTARILDVGTSSVASLLNQARRSVLRALRPGDSADLDQGDDVIQAGDQTDATEVGVQADTAGEHDDQVAGADDEDFDVVPLAGSEPEGADETSGSSLPSAADLIAPLQVPAHGPDFWNDLGRQLIVERRSPALPTPSAMAMAARAPTAGTQPADGLGPAAHPWPDLGNHVSAGVGGVPLGSIGIVVLGLVAVVGVVALALRIGADAEPPLERQGTIAQDVGDRVATRLAGLQSFSAVIERTEISGDDESSAGYKLVRSGDGSYQLIALAGNRTVAYHAPSDTRRERVVTEGPAGQTVIAREDTGFAGGPPDPNPGDISLPDADVGLALRSLRSSGRRLAKEVIVDGRKMWMLEAELEEGAAVGADAIVLTVDQARLLPHTVRITADGQPVRTTTFGAVEPNAAISPASFSIDFAPGDNVVRTDHGFAPIALRDVGNTLGFEALRPTFLPEGFVLDATQVRAEGTVVSLRYRRGFERVFVSTRRSPVPAGSPWPDPFSARGEVLPGSSLTLRTGAFAQKSVSVATGADGKLELWGSDGSFAITVAGDLTRTEIQQVAESLR